jgi:hypothetical protein
MTMVFLGSLAFPAIFAGLIALSGYNAALLCVAVVNAFAAVYVYLRLNQARP